MSTEECSSSESGWTRYIATPDHVDQHDDDGDDEEDEEDLRVDSKRSYKQDVDSDDSMASDASSGPSYQYGHFIRHHGLGNKDERKYQGKKSEQQDEKKQQIKVAKDKSGRKADSAGKSKKR